MGKPDMVNHPAHYTAGGIECIDAIKAAVTGLTGMEAHCTGTAIKYLWRWKRKGGEQDIDKAIWYLNRLKNELHESKELSEKEKLELWSTSQTAWGSEEDFKYLYKVCYNSWCIECPLNSSGVACVDLRQDDP